MAGRLFMVALLIYFMAYSWVWYGLGSAVCFTVMTLVFKKLLLLDVSPLVLNLLVFGFTFTGFLAWAWASKTPLNLSLLVVLLVALASLCSLAGNFLDVLAVKNAPNPGYAATLKATQMALVTLAAPLLFRSELTFVKLVGVALVLAGVAVIALA